jgi:hypothetical protein
MSRSRPIRRAHGPARQGFDIYMSLTNWPLIGPSHFIGLSPHQRWLVTWPPVTVTWPAGVSWSRQMV